jgi:hypothetical protein
MTNMFFKFFHFWGSGRILMGCKLLSNPVKIYRPKIILCRGLKNREENAKGRKCFCGDDREGGFSHL